MKITAQYSLKLVTVLAALGFAGGWSVALRAQTATQTQAQPEKNAQQSIGPAPTTSANAAAETPASPSTSSGQLTAVATPGPAPQADSPASSTSAGSSSSPDPAAVNPAPAPMPLPNPSMTVPLSTAAPAHEFDAGPFGKLAVTGILSGMGLFQNNWVPGDKASHWDLSNAQVFVQKTTGWWQFYVQGGPYNLPDLGVPFISTNKTLPDFFGPVPVAYLKLVKGGFSVQVGELPTLIGAEYTFDFENLNIERGILWNQENAVNRGIQLNETYKKLSLSLSWNDGFYSDRYTWLTGSLAYALNAANTISFVAGGNAGETRFTTVATPVQNNSSIYNIIYTYTHGSWYVQPYWQYTTVPTNAKIGIAKGASTDGFALLFNYNFKHGVSLAVRPEYISSNGSLANGAVNLLYGPGSNAFAFTVTPTYQKGAFYLRADLGVVNARSFTAGDAFGPLGQNGTQTRGALEAGFLF